MADSMSQVDIAEVKMENEEEGLRRLPVYVVIDTSYSMTAHGRIDAVKTQLPLVFSKLAVAPDIDFKARVSILDMSNETRVLHNMRRPSELPTTFDVSAGGGTNYSAAFELLRNEIEKDYRGFSGDDVKVFRAAVIFITDGEPTCSRPDRDAAFDALMDPNWERYPYMIMVGVGRGVNESTLKNYAYPTEAIIAAKPNKASVEPMMVHVKDEEASASVIAEIVASLMHSIVNSGASSDEPTEGGGPRDVDEATLVAEMLKVADDIELHDDIEF